VLSFKVYRIYSGNWISWLSQDWR